MQVFEISFPQRKIVSSEEEFLKEVNKYNGIRQIYRSVYNFRSLREPGKINYNTCVLDKIFFDFDGSSAQKNMLKLHNFLKKKNIKHIVRFSGSKGFHIFVFITPVAKHQNPRNLLWKMYETLIHNVEKGYGNFIFDTQVKGDIARQARVENTMHIKSKLFCIPLKEDELQKDLKDIKEMAKNQRFGVPPIGQKLLGFSDSYVSKSVEIKTMELPEDFDHKVAMLNLEEYPPCVAKEILDSEEIEGKRVVRHFERMHIIIFLRDMGLTYEETKATMAKFITPEKMYHCVKEQGGQLPNLFEEHNKNTTFPCYTIKMQGKCPIKEGYCDKYNELYHNGKTKL